MHIELKISIPQTFTMLEISFKIEIIMSAIEQQPIDGRVDKDRNISSQWWTMFHPTSVEKNRSLASAVLSSNPKIEKGTRMRARLVDLRSLCNFHFDCQEISLTKIPLLCPLILSFLLILFGSKFFMTTEIRRSRQGPISRYHLSNLM